MDVQDTDRAGNPPEPAAAAPPPPAPGPINPNPNPAANRIPGIDSWLMDIPPVTRCWVVAAIGTSLAVQCQLIAPIQLYFSWKTAFGNMQLHRLLTTFTYFSPLSIDLAFNLFFVMRYSRLIEENDFSRNKADFLALLGWNGAVLLCISHVYTIPFLSSSLAFSLVYLWSRRNPAVKMSLFGLITITAPYLPIFLVGISWVMSGTYEAALGDIMGIVVGHVYYFLMDVWPREMHHPTGEGPIRAPVFV